MGCKTAGKKILFRPGKALFEGENHIGYGKQIFGILSTAFGIMEKDLGTAIDPDVYAALRRGFARLEAVSEAEAAEQAA